jgi:hypothetical protein
VLTVTSAFPARRRSSAPRVVNISSGTGSIAWSAGPAREFALAAGSFRRGLPQLQDPLHALPLLRPDAGPGFKVKALAAGLRRTDLNALAAQSDGDPAEATGPRPADQIQSRRLKPR